MIHIGRTRTRRKGNWIHLDQGSGHLTGFCHKGTFKNCFLVMKWLIIPREWALPPGIYLASCSTSPEDFTIGTWRRSSWAGWEALRRLNKQTNTFSLALHYLFLSFYVNKGRNSRNHSGHLPRAPTLTAACGISLCVTSDPFRCHSSTTICHL